MKFICTQENLLAGLGHVAPLAGRNTQLPVLNNVLLQLREGVLHLTCTDLELGIHTIVPGKVEAEGSCTVIARKFLEYIQHLPTDNPLTIEFKKNTIHVTTPGFTAQFPTTTDDDFPLLPQATGNTEITLNAQRFCAGLSRAAFAAARDNTRPEIHSVFVVGTGKTISLAATDSFRLAEEVITRKEEGDSFSFLLPLATTHEVVRLFAQQEKITLYPQDNHLAIHGDGIEISSRLVEGKYPDYQQIIPTTFKTTGTINRDELLQALKTLTVFLPRDSRRVQLKVQPARGRLGLAVAGSDTGAGDVDLEFSGTGDELEILFNIQYLLDGIGYLPGKQCQLQFVGTADPAVFRPTNTDIQYQYVVMPIQV